MIISALTGGLGNQLFQYATGFATAQRLGMRFAVDISHFEEHRIARLSDRTLPDRPYALDRLTISAGVASAVDQLRIDATRGGQRLAAKIVRRIPGMKLDVVVDREDGDGKVLRDLSDGAYLTGCWQSENYFADHREQLAREFRFARPPDSTNAELIDAIRACRSVSVHFRRTDYLLQSTLTKPCSLEYYERAFAAMHAAYPDAWYFVFTDDPEWVERFASLPERSTLVAHNVGIDDAEDMRLMQHCDHFIVANSSFSWWGAWLGRSPDKKVFAPSVWFERPHRNEAVVVPESWVRL